MFVCSKGKRVVGLSNFEGSVRLMRTRSITVNNSILRLHAVYAAPLQQVPQLDEQDLPRRNEGIRLIHQKVLLTPKIDEFPVALATISFVCSKEPI